MSSTSAQPAVAKFAPLQSCVDVSFWSELADRKLNEYKLDDQPVSISGWFAPSRYAQLPGQLLLDAGSFPSADRLEGTFKKQGHTAPGTLLNANTVEAFQRLDPAALLRAAAAQLWADVLCGAAEADPSRLAAFWLVTHAELKRWHFTYWALLPALKPPAPFRCTAAEPLATALGSGALARQVASACDVWRDTSTANRHAPHAWLLVLPQTAEGTYAPGRAEAVPLTSWQTLAAAGVAASGVLLAVSDTSNVAGHAGWLLRNLLLLAAKRWRVPRLQVVCVRDSSGRTDPERSWVLDIVLPLLPEGWCDQGCPDAVGWEADASGRLAPRTVDLSAHMSPENLAAQAVDLNLRLMRWRAAPDMDIARVSSTKCLLLGSGTLGCTVARTLLAWGVRNITLLDSSRVAFSNPVRQSLFTFADCLHGGRPKAQAAADALSTIFPLVNARAVDMTIPMPGHAPASAAEEAALLEAATQLDALVQEHDAVFLLTDTRESRWLPSLLAAAYGKLAITAAVGFDSFLVMRHGHGPGGRPGDSLASSPPRLGCYFCNDVVAPLNSTRDRTLDQQCTVARPGLAPIASAVAVELMVALLQHPAGLHAPPASGDGGGAGPSSGGGDAAGGLGPVPHMVRGQLSGFQQTVMTGHAFSQCTACSPAVVDEYRAHGSAFLLRATKEHQFLEDLTGLTALHQQTDGMLGTDSDEDEGAEGGEAAAADGTTGGGGEPGDSPEDWTEL